MKHLAVFSAGLIFGFGLIISGMVNPEKVLGFLDVAGKWDPSLAFVMGGAVLVTFFGYRYALGKSAPLFDDTFRIPSNVLVDYKLIGGAIIFGAGWGLMGLCPGPAIAGLTVEPMSLLTFFVAMLSGMYLARRGLKHDT